MTHRARRSAGQPLLAVAAAATVVAAVAMDVLADEHPSHTVALGLVAVVVAVLRLSLAGRYEGVFAAVSGALVAQPALHAMSKIGRTAGGRDHPHGDLLHVVASDGPGAAMQVVVPALVVVAVAFSAQFLNLLVGALIRPLDLVPPRPLTELRRVLVTVRTCPRGSMLCRCGWAIRAGRRGPPALWVPAH